MRKVLLAFITLGLFVSSPALAQLVGTDTVPGSSCAGFPDGATRMTGDADLNGGDVVLVCDGTNWTVAAGGGLPSCPSGDILVRAASGWICSSAQTTMTSFDFTDVTTASRDMVVTSDWIYVGGFDGMVPISITGSGSPEYRIRDDGYIIQDWTSANSVIPRGASLQTRLTASSAVSTARTANVSIAAVPTPITWTATTHDIGTMTFVASATSTSASVTIPASAQVGDIAVVVVTAPNSSQNFGGWGTTVNLVNASSGGTDWVVARAKILEAGDPGNSLATNACNCAESVVMVFRPNASVGGIAAPSPWNVEPLTTNNPAAQNVDATGFGYPIIVFGAAGVTGTAAFSTATPAFDGTVASSNGDLIVGYKIYNAPTPSDHTIDMNDLGTDNVLLSGALTFTK